MAKKNIIGMTEDELRHFCIEKGFRDFHGTQIFNWIYHKNPQTFSDMTDLPTQLRQKLTTEFYLGYLRIYKRDISRKKDAIKYGFLLRDRVKIEAVALLDRSRRISFCISSQAGCALGCLYCATGKIGFLRNLSAQEIISQVLTLKREHGNPHSILFMGMGEPLLNYNETLKALKIFQTIGIGSRKITISTCGIIKRIYDLAFSGVNVRLAVSIGSAIQEKRIMLIPYSKKNSLSQLKKALIFYRGKTGRRVSLEYTLIDGLNHTQEDATALAEFAKEVCGHVNLIRFNPVKNSGLASPDTNTVLMFKEILQKYGIEVSERYRKGQDISAACGQLVVEHLR